MNIEFIYEKEDYKLLDEEAAIIWIEKVIDNEEKKLGEIIFNFVSEKKILSVNRKFLRHNYYTDIITFDDSFVNIINGNIFISPDTIKTNAQNFKTKMIIELYRVVIHGVMHLCGYGDFTQEEKDLMRSKENQYLNYLEEL